MQFDSSENVLIPPFPPEGIFPDRGPTVDSSLSAPEKYSAPSSWPPWLPVRNMLSSAFSFPLWERYHFSLPLLRFFPLLLHLVFRSLIMMCLGADFFLSPVWALFRFWTWGFCIYGLCLLPAPGNLEPFFNSSNFWSPSFSPRVLMADFRALVAALQTAEPLLMPFQFVFSLFSWDSFLFLP